MIKLTLLVATIGLPLFVQYRLIATGVDPIASPVPELPVFPTTIYNITHKVHVIGNGELVGPESLVASNGYLFAALGNGRIARIRQTNDGDHEWDFLVRTGDDGPRECGFSPSDESQTEAQCGRPLGMKIVKRSTVDPQSDSKDDVLVVADAYKGLLLISGIYETDVTKAEMTTLATRASTDPPDSHFRLLNALVVAPSDGSIYFTETSQTFPRRRIFFAAFDGRHNGRLLRYNPKAKEKVTVVATDLYMPNGIALSHNQKELLIVCGVQIKRFSLKKGEMMPEDDFVHVLPGTGDNIDAMDHLPMANPNKRHQKCYWAGLGSKFAQPFSLLKIASEKPWFKSIVVALVPYRILVNSIPKLSALAVYDERGTLLQVYKDDSNVFPWISEGETMGNNVYLGSWYNRGLAYFTTTSDGEDGAATADA